MGVSILSYYYLFDRRLEHHPRFLKNQIKMEIDMSLRSQPIIAAMIVPWFVAEIRGNTLMYDNFNDYGAGWFQGTWAQGMGPWVYTAGSMAVFLLFTDFCIYWIHRWLHIPAIYKRLHKPHHKWVGESASRD
jgi:lathosterol oxidase